MLRALLVVTLVSLVTCEQCESSSASSCEGEATDSSFIQGKRKTPSPQRKPHVLLILADDYGWANFGKHRLSSATAEDRQAQAEVQTPNMDSLVDNGILLERHYAYKICSPSRCSLQTGRLAVHVNTVNTGVTYWNPGDNVSGFAGIPRNMTGVAKKMKAGGYKTHMVGKWDAGMATPEHSPLGKGYDTWLGYFQHANDYWQESMPLASTGNLDVCLNEFRDFSFYNDTYHGPVIEEIAAELGCDQSVRHSMRKPNIQPQVNATGCNLEDPDYCLPDSCYEEAMFNARALQVIKEHDLTDQDSPLFLFYAFHLLHTPLQLPNSYLEEIDKLANASGQQQLPWTQNRRLYAGMTLYLDTMIGRVIKELQRRQDGSGTMYDNTLIVFTADNGGPVYEPGSANNNPLKGGKYSDWEGAVRTNAFVSGGFVPPHRRGKKFRGVMSIADWYTTLCEIAGVESTDYEARKANRYMVENGLTPLLHPVDGRAQWQSIINNQNGRPDPLHLSANALLWWPYKLVTGTQPYSFWQGTIYPNCSVTVKDLKDGPFFSDMHVFGIPVPLSDNTTQQDAYTFAEDCGDGGCLFNVEVDPTEHNDLAQDPAYANQLFKMQMKLYWKNMQNFNPNRGEPALQACDQGADLGGFYGPFVDAEDFYEGFELNARQKAVAEAMKEQFRRLNHSLDNHLEAVIERITEQAGLVELVELFKQSPNMTLDQCTNED